MSLDLLNYKNSALLVIDMQNAFLHKEGTLGISGVDTDRLSKIVPATENIIKHFHEAEVPVIWTVQEHFQQDSSRAKKLLSAHTSRRKQISCLSSSWDAKIIDELDELSQVNPSLVITKHRFGAFHETRLDIILRMLGVNVLFITGTTTNACVETSIREAYLRDIDAVAVTDCISGVNENWEATAQEVWNQYFCTTSTSDQVIEWLEQQTKPRALNFGHMLLFVSDMEISKSFYVDMLGFKVRPAKPLADGREFIAFQQGIAIVNGLAPNNKQVDHMAFRVNDIKSLRNRLNKNDIKFFQDLHDGPYGLTIYIEDPDGNKIELYQEEL